MHTVKQLCCSAAESDCEWQGQIAKDMQCRTVNIYQYKDDAKILKT